MRTPKEMRFKTLVLLLHPSVKPLEYSPYLAAGVLCIELIENIDERRHVVLRAVDAVNTVVDGNETNVVVGEYHLGIHTDLQVIASKTAHILDDNRANKPVINHSTESIPVRAVEVRAAVPVIGCCTVRTNKITP